MGKSAAVGHREADDPGLRNRVKACAEPHPAGTEVVATARTIPRARALRRKASVRISIAASSSSLALSPTSRRARPGRATAASALAAPSASLCLCHGLSCLDAAGGRLVQPGDAQAEPLEAGGARRAIASMRHRPTTSARSDRPASTDRVIGMRGTRSCPAGIRTSPFALGPADLAVVLWRRSTRPPGSTPDDRNATPAIVPGVVGRTIAMLVIGYPLPSTWGRSVAACRRASRARAWTTHGPSRSS